MSNKVSDNLNPKLILVEGSAPANPASGNQSMFIDSADHKLKRVNSSGTVTTVESSGATLGANTFTGNQTMPAAIISGLTGSTAGMRLVGSTASGAPSTGAHLVGDVSLSLADGLWYTCTVAGTPGTWVTPSSGSSSLTTASASLSADVTMTSANTFYDGPSVSLAAGTWFVFASINTKLPTTPAGVTAKIWDGTTVFTAGEHVISSNAYMAQIAVATFVAPGSTTTYKVSAAGQTSGGTIKAQVDNATGSNTGSQIIAIKVG